MNYFAPAFVPRTQPRFVPPTHPINTHRVQFNYERPCEMAWRYMNNWRKELSFNVLREKGLINCYSEWKSLKTAFYSRAVTPDFIYKWLYQQNGNFRVSYLSHILICGYSRNVSSLFNVTEIPLDVENMIISYCNIIFIKFYNSSKCNKYELRTFDANFTINNLTKILEREKNLTKYSKFMGANYKRIWCRYNSLKFLYSIQKNGKKYVQKENDNRWVEIPDDVYSDLTIKDMDNKLKFNEILELGVDTLTKTYFDRNINSENWVFMKEESDVNNDNYNRLEWLCSLQIGSIINIRNKYGIWMEGYIKYRDYDRFYVHFINNSNDEEIKSVGIDLDRLQKRSSHCKWSGMSNNRKSNKLVFCHWISAFTGPSMHLPVLID